MNIYEKWNFITSITKNKIAYTRGVLIFGLLDNHIFYLWDSSLYTYILNIYVYKWHDDTSSNPGRDWLHFT